MLNSSVNLLAIDLHNTIYDEVMEYGLAMEEAVSFWLEAAEERGLSLDKENFYKEISFEHKKACSDWDSDIWDKIPSIKKLNLSDEDFIKKKEKALSLRDKKSRELTVKYGFSNTIKAIKAIKERGVKVFIVTEAVAEVAQNAIKWLGLDSFIDGLYSYPCSVSFLNNKAQILENNRGYRCKSFPSDENTKGYIKKPNALIIASLIFDELKNKKDNQGNLIVDSSVVLSDIFELVNNNPDKFSELKKSNYSAWKEVTSSLAVKDTVYKKITEEIRQGILYVGDSMFKDGFLAGNSGVKFGFASYGKNIIYNEEEEKVYKKSYEILEKVTGWDTKDIRLTHFNNSSEEFKNIKIDFFLKNSLYDLLEK